ncbi:MAG TPA: HhH-GPD-type base excision DNA repair protein, partial [Acidothermaceae bacterium]|nr:HhH-GPD-type base excision DNA repair protein [Acidothermaceae bacterium]
MSLFLAQDADADALLDRDPFALLLGMMLDQQIPMEKAFFGPKLLAERMGVDRLEPADIAGHDPETFAKVFAGPPAIHRFPGAMAARAQALARVVADQYDGDAAKIWDGVSSGDQLLKRLSDLPGFGEQKARIFLALLGKQRGVRPRGWRAAAGAFGEDGIYHSVADVTSEES